MTLEEARAVVAKLTSTEELDGPQWVSWFRDCSSVTLDGSFTPSDLEAISICMRTGDPSPC